MKRWHIIAGSVVLFIALVVAILSLVFRYVIVPNYIQPFATKASEKLKDDAFLDSLYDQATKLHDDGTLKDDVYSRFIAAYNRHNSDKNEFADEVLGDDYDDTYAESASNTKRASYASTKVGIDLIQTNDSGISGKADSSYSAERNSNRTKAEDIVEAEKIRSGLANSEATEAPTDTPEEMEAKAMQKLMDNMTASEAAKFRSLMQKLDLDVLRSHSDGHDLDGLREYLHSNLNDTEYRELVNLGYKYMNLFIE
ncbi:MAG: hypothetical protein IJH94_06810 [Clostridia bacterium]|nr:hypothetical protein [Clostridia bacterium]